MSQAHPRRVIGLCGLAGAGKTSAAEILVDQQGFQRRPFAGPLKAMACAILSAREMAGDLKETPLPHLCGKSPRQFMQLLGTEFGRDLIGPDFWVDTWRRGVDELDAIYGTKMPIVADDVRFANEAAAIRAMGGIIIRIDRKGAGSATGAGHVSEALAFEVDSVIANDGDLHDLAVALGMFA